MSKIMHFLLMLVSVNYIFAQIPTAPSEGDGSEVNPFTISSLENLYWIAADTANWKYCYVQTENIDASGTALWFTGDHDGIPGTPDIPMGWVPIGNEVKAFRGWYDGQKHSITGLFINRPAYSFQGLFGSVADSKIDSLFLLACSVSGSNYTAGLVGFNRNSFLTNCYVSGSVSGSGDVGGVVGNNANSRITKCGSEAEVQGESFIGGLIGYSITSLIADSWVKAAVSGQYDVGGFTGNLTASDVRRCFSSGDVSGLSYVGGFIGRSQDGSYVETSYSEGNINAPGNYTGGFIGYNSGSDVSNCYALGNVIGDADAGGFIGNANNNSIIINCYSIGAPSGTNFVGGFIGYAPAAQITGCFWDTETSLLSASYAGTGLVTADMKNNETFINAGWSSEVWYMDGIYNSGYPYLFWQYDDGSPLPVEEIITEVSSFGLEQNYPNPFNPVTTIKYSIPSGIETLQATSLRIYDILGKEVAVLVNQKQAAGNYEVKFDANNIASGVYIYRIESGNFSDSKRMMLVK